MKAGYNPLGQLVSEMWYDSSETLTAHYRYAYDHQGNIVRSVDILAKKEYNYSYEEGRLLRATECDITLDDATGMVTAKTLVNTLRYYYDREGTLVRRMRIPVDGLREIRYYETGDDNNSVLKVQNNEKVYTSHSRTDALGRKVFDEIQTGWGNIHRQFLYTPGEANEVYTTTGDKGLLKSAPTTQLVKQIILSDGRTISYEYDAEDRITRVEDSLEGITQYTYDAQGQLLTETRNNVVVNVMTYDKYGNILTKNGKAYVYDTVWKDKLLSCDSSVYEYDTQGNPIHYDGNRMIWEKGRQLKCIQNGQNQFLYTYNANGIRTSKTVNGVKHSFILDGAKILGEYWDGNTLIPLYDNEDNVCGILHNDCPYYFLKNLQGDVIAITNQRGETVARYTYDAWGACTVSYDATATPTVEGGETINIATVNPFRYRSYYFDTETGLYYLQSRYYDPNLGRFLNGDEPVLNCLSAVSKGLNAFVYCNNNCVNVTDKTGYVAGVDDAAVAVVAVALIALCVVLVSLLVQLGIALSEYWVDFCHAVGNGLAWMGSAIANAAIFVWRWSTKVVKAAIAAVATSTAILKAQKKVEKRVKAAKKNVYRFFEIWFDDIGAPILGKSLSRERAVVRAKCGLNSITYFSSDARYVANRAGGAHAMWHQRHGGLGYFNHYHINKHRNSAHIYYIIWG